LQSRAALDTELGEREIDGFTIGAEEQPISALKTKFGLARIICLASWAAHEYLVFVMLLFQLERVVPHYTTSSMIKRIMSPGNAHQ
jgi:hypothetical protein